MISARLALAIVLVAASAAFAQVYPASSIDPLNGTSFSTPFYTPPVTYTITTTFPSAGPTTATVISGSAGPSPATGSYSFSYNAPISSVTGLANPALSSSLLANGLPVVYTNAFQAPTKDLQIVDAAPGSLDIPFFAIGSMAIAGILGALWIL
ncbi:uncharacterized protein FA14DRAFT_178058 [Meira miltonrushii]|uniref:Uncharacterized protein n=1 Tax=Meira miltonrushii TaxID=1280837 RepID=A0A316VF60_9BASI|nr:uncharacterized protein FA14DRAFT_178058 [Meira miltonrushii]PWN34651.1 hypothetical protein FA14DRAFT_178058 [Meira miltonrushii]